VSIQDSMEGLIIWPFLFGSYEYGFKVQKDGEVYEINLDEALNPIDQGDETAARLLEEYGDQLQTMLSKAKEVWNLI